MTTDFTYGGKQILSSGPFKPNGKDMPNDARTRVESYADIASIPNPYVGLKITVKVDETNNNKMTDYIVKSIKANSIGVANSLIDEVVRYVDYLGVNGQSVDTNNFATKEELGLKADKTELHSHINKTVLDGIASTNVDNWNNKVDKVEGKTLTTNDYTNEEKQTVASLKATVGDTSSGLVKDVKDLKTNGVSQDNINAAIENYLTEHPVAGGATTEQANQIQANANAIGNESSGLIKEVNDMKSVIGDSNSGLVKDVTDLKANSDAGGSTPVALTEPYDDDIPRIFLSEGILPTTKTSTTMKFEYISKNKRYSGYVDIKCQGTSSMAYAKKNFTIKTFNDKALTTKMKINFKNWGNQNKFCLKANFIDISHARNIVSARLWSDVVKTRENYLELPELLKTSPNSGAIDGFFVKIYANGVYQGRYTMNIPKDGWMANMDKSLNEHCILSGENYQSGLFRKTALINGTDWSDELHDTVPASILNRWNQVINFVMSSSDSEFKANIGQYFDLTSLIDYYIFAYVSCGLDSMGKNQIYMTYDGQKWFASMYDMDSTWGLYWNGQRFVSASYRMQDDYESGANGNQKNLLYLRLEQTFVDEIKERYAVLRNGALSETNIINKFEEFMICNSDLIKEDYEIFSGIPSQNTNNIKQIRQYVVDRCKYVDEQIDNLVMPVPCTGITLDKTSLTFTDNTPQTLQVTVEPTNTTDKISYSINPTGIAKIADGTVTPLKNGTATITVTCGTISKTCSVDITGIEEGSVTDDYTALDLSSIQKGQSFKVYDGALDLNEQTVFADITLDDSSANQNIISIGQVIEAWSGSGAKLHCYYPKPSTNSTRTLEMVLVNNLELRDNVTITNNKLRMALNANGIYANGTKAVIISEHVSFTSFIAQKTAQIGSLEGRIRSNATYNEIRIYNRALSREELITLTSI